MVTREQLLTQINSGKLPSDVLEKRKYQLKQLDGEELIIGKTYLGYWNCGNGQESFCVFIPDGKNSGALRFFNMIYKNLEGLPYPFHNGYFRLL